MDRKEFSFLSKGGEMADLTDRYDWSQTSVGSIDSWSPVLQAHLGMMLSSRFPMLIFWGPDLITFYNDAFRPSLGDNGKHPSSLGQKGEQSWSESWPVIGPMIRGIMAGADAVWFEDQKLPLIRDGKTGYAYWTYSFSPLNDDNGEIGGILVTCMETTKVVESFEKMEESERRFRNLVEQALTPICILKGEDMVLELGNEPLLNVWQTDHSAIGKPLLEILPEMADQPIMDWLLDVYRNGITLNLNEISARFERKTGDVEIRYFNFVYQPYREADGTISGVTAMAIEITEHVVNRQRLLSLFEQAPVAIGVLSKDRLRFELANPSYCEIIGRTKEEILGKPMLEAVPEAAGQGFDMLMNQVIDSGESFAAQEMPARLYRDGQLSNVFINLSFEPWYDHNGKVTGVLVVGVDVTTLVTARKGVEDSEGRFRSLIEEAPVATCLFVGPEMRVEVINAKMVDAWGKDFSVIDKPLIKALPELEGQPFMDLLADVYRTGKAYEGIAAPVDLFINGRLDTYYYDFTYKPLLNEDGQAWAIINVSINVTDRVLATRRLEESEARFRSLIEEAPVATCLFVGRDLRVEVANDLMLNVWGKGRSVIGLPLAEAVPELVGQPYLDLLDQVFETGQPYSDTSAEAQLNVNGVLGTYYFSFTYKPLFDADGNVYAVMDMASDVTEQVVARKRIEEAEASLSNAIELAELATWSVNLVTGTISYSPRLQEWIGVPNEQLTLDDLYPVHEDDRARVKEALERAVSEGSNGQLDEIYTVVHAETGRQRIIHVIGKATVAASGQSILFSGAAQDITIQRQLQMELEAEVAVQTEELAGAVQDLAKANDRLEESNKQLLRSNEELAQYAYVASHDLQEPLRKIRFFSGKLQANGQSPEQRAAAIEKISRSTERMSMLIHDLLEFSRLLRSDALIRRVDLAAVVQDVVKDFELLVAEKEASIHIGDLPVIEGVRLQMNQLFYNLVGNALKFTKTDRKPAISIDSREAAPEEIAAYIETPVPDSLYHHITVRDNGIGFDPLYLEQIFEVFKRLHGRDEYGGSGIGLAICRRVVQNHKGRIFAEAERGEGATFHIILPERQSGRQEPLPSEFAWKEE